MLALRKTKISRNIYATCNRLYGKTEFTSFTKRASENVNFEGVRHNVTNTTRPAVLPKLDFPPVEPQRRLLSEMQYLQPARQSKFISVAADYSPLNSYEPWAEGMQPKSFIVECPFPRPIIEPQHNGMTFTEKTKKISPFKGNMNQPVRNYSTSPFRMVARGFAKKKQDDKCENQKKPCRKNAACPRFIPKQCEASKGSQCHHYYIDPKCTKKMAPYKSYSETCHEILEDDPSECFQCPWQKCRGIESVKPPKRKYHTWNIGRRECNVAMFSTGVSNNNLPTVSHECDASKKPCKPPPPKCVKKEKKKNCPPSPSKNKKKCIYDNWPGTYRLWCDQENAVPAPTWVAPGGDLWYATEHFVPAKPWMQSSGLCCVTSDNFGSQIEKLAIKDHDKGHPPPCPVKKHPSKQCPKKVDEELPYKHQRDLTHPSYKRNPDPYSDDDLRK